MDIGTKLKEARLRKGLTQEQAAAAAQVSRQTMSSWENRRSLPDILSVIRLAEVYGISLDELTKSQEDESQKISFLERHWDTLYSAAIASIPLAVLAEHYLSRGAAFLLLALGAALFALPRLLFARVFGGGLKNVALGILGWALVLGRTVWMLLGGRFSLPVYLVMLTGVALVFFVRLRELGGRDRSRKWHHWVVLGLLAASMALPWFTDTLTDGGFNKTNPFLHPYRIAQPEYGEAPRILVELGNENELRFIDPMADTAESIGSFIYREPAEGTQEAAVAGIWELVPEEAGALYRLTVGTDGTVRLSHWIDDQLQWRWRLQRADALRWSTRSGGAVSGGTLVWFPEGTFDGDPDRLNSSVLSGTGTVAIMSEEPAEQLTLHEIRGDQETVHALNPSESGSFSITLSGQPGELVLCRIPWADGDYWLLVEFQ